MICNWNGVCWRCQTPYPAGTDLVKRHGDWVHSTCVPGADDE